MEIFPKCIEQSTSELYRSTSSLLEMSSQELNILNRRVVAGTSHGDEILVENETNEAIQEATEETHNHIAKQIFTDFCDNSTVQGVRYLTKPKLHWIERLFWSAAIVSSFLFCFIGMSNLWQTWNKNPVMVKYDDKITSIRKFPFPAITICPTKKFFKETVNIKKILDAIETNNLALDELTLTELCQMNLIVQTCINLKFHSIPDKMIILSQTPVLETFENITNYNNFETIYASFHGIIYRHLKQILTPEGLCFTFNSLNSDEIFTNETVSDIKTVRNNPRAIHWNRDDGYHSNGNKQNIYPSRPFSSLSQFSAILRISPDDSHKRCSPIALGFHLSVHAPDELPRVSSDFIHIPPEQQSTIVIKPNVIATSDSLRSYAPHARNCFFGSESRLHFFKSYTQNNCELECLTNFTKNECGCVHFSMPRIKSTRVCTMLDMNCYTGAKHAFGKNESVKSCACLPDCTSFSHNVEVSQAQQPFYTKEVKINRLNYRYRGFNDTSLSSITVSFKEPHFIVMMRVESSTMFDFISNCGSLLGMCLGVSILSIVELVYFLTLRLFLLWRGREPAQTNADSHRTLTSIMKKPFEKLKLRFQSKKPKHEIITVRPICNDDPDQIWNESEEQTEEVGTQKQFCLRMIEDFCNNSTVHGFRYFTELNRHRVERVWWAIAVTSSIVICIVAIFSIWTDWQQNPVITAFDDGRTPIETVPFPAVTVCPMKRLYPEIVAKILKAGRGGSLDFEKFSDEERCLIDALSQILPEFLNIERNLNMTIPSCPSIYETIKSMALDPDSVVSQISWLCQQEQLSFKPIFTSGLGRCYSFNSLRPNLRGVSSELKTVHSNPNATYWNREDGYQPNIKQSDLYPRRLYDAGIFGGLFARFNTVFDSSYALYSMVIPGLLQLSIHSPDELPGIRFDDLYISSEQDTFVSIRPTVISTSNGLRSYAPSTRGCYYNSERHLRFFKSYSHQKCEWECLTNFTKNKCGCVPFAMPSVADTKMCSMFDKICYRPAKSEFNLKNKIDECDCLPDCNSISYQAEISTSPFHFYEDDHTRNVIKLYHKRGISTSMRLFVSFKADHFTTINRTEIMTMSDFISTCGGLFGLFMGISWLSIVELLYYFTLRLSRKWIQPEADTDSEAEDDIEIQDVGVASFRANSEAEINAITEFTIENHNDTATEDEADISVDIEVYAEIHYDAAASTKSEFNASPDVGTETQNDSVGNN